MVGEGAVAEESWDGIRVIDDRTVRICLNQKETTPVTAAIGVLTADVTNLGREVTPEDAEASLGKVILQG